MSAEFILMERHIDAPRAPSGDARLVLSRLGAGRSVIAAPGPSIKFVLEGDEAYEIDGRMYRVQSGQFLYVDRGADCFAHLRGASTGFCMNLPAGWNKAAPAGEEAPLLGRAMTFSARTSGLGRMLAGWGGRIARDPRLGPMLAGEVARAVTCAIEEPLAESRAAMARLKAVRPATRRELFQRLERARGHLHEHKARAVSQAELAGVAGLSQFHLARYFKLAFGAAPIAYHRALRLDCAADMLRGGKSSVAEIAEAVGYSDQVALTHAFRKQFGSAPHCWLRSQEG
jgi:AraC-like DNA-binding protein